MNRNKLKSLAAFFVLLLVFITTSGIAAAATADSDEQFAAPNDQDAQTWNSYMTNYQQVYNYHDSKSSVLGRIPGDTIWMMSSHGGDCGGWCGIRLTLYNGEIINAGDVGPKSNSIKLAYSDACISGVDTWYYDLWEGFINSGTKSFIGFNRVVDTSETPVFTNWFGYYLKGGSTVSDAAFKADFRASMHGAYSIYGDGSITI